MSHLSARLCHFCIVSRDISHWGGVLSYRTNLSKPLDHQPRCSRQPGYGMECPAMLCAMAMSRTRGTRDDDLPNMEALDRRARLGPFSPIAGMNNQFH